MKKTLIIITIIGLIILFILNFYFIRSVIVMVPYNIFNIQSSFIDEENIKLEIPKEGNLQWYPLMNKFNAIYFSKYIDKDVDLVIYYTYGAFNNRYSDIFREDSPTYSSYYGAYVTKNNTQESFIFTDSGDLILEDVEDILIYDYKYLVLRPLGYNKYVKVDFEIIEKRENETEIVITANIQMNGLAHSYKKFNSDYLQYGTPGNYNEEDFQTINTYGKFVVHKSEGHINVIYYIINQDLSVVNGWNG